jgi:serine/threonine-protein kinase
MAPERLEGHTHVDERSDLYSLGALMYTLLAGHPPFEGATLFDVILKVRSQEPENPKKFQMGVPDSFNGVVLRLLAKRPTDRYQTADELLTDLERMAKFVGVTL